MYLHDRLHTNCSAARHLLLALCVFCMLAAGLAAWTGGSALAKGAASGDTLVLSLDTPSTITHDQVAHMTAVLTLPAPPPPSEQMGVAVTFSHAMQIGSYSPTISNGGLTYTFSLASSLSGPIPAGQYPALVATFTDTSTSPSQIITSNPISLTIVPAPTKTTCLPGDGSGISPASSPLGVTVSVASSDGIFDDVYIGNEHPTYSIAFIGGPSPTSTQHLTPNIQNIVTATTPAQIGLYHIVCSFDGTSDFAPSQTSGGAVTISEERQISGIQAYVDPSSPEANQPFTVYVVVKGPSGAPTPSGSIELQNMRCFDKSAPLSAAGTALVTLSTGCADSNWGAMTVWYSGDLHYYGEVFRIIAKPFAPIPASVQSGGGTGGAGGNPSGNAGQGNSSQATATPPSATATVNQVGGTFLARHGSPTATSGSLWIDLAAVLIIIVGASGMCIGLLLLIRSRMPVRGDSTDTNP